jgi:hypothetical protein
LLEQINFPAGVIEIFEITPESAGSSNFDLPENM